MCLGDTRELNGFMPDRPSAPISYLWEPTGDTTYLFNVQEAGTYSVTVKNRCGSSTDMVNVITIAPPEVEDRPDSTICDGEFFHHDVTWPEASYLWEDGFTGPSRIISEGGLYTIEVSNQCGTVADTFFVDAIDCECTVFMPTAFSPNGDGVNEQFGIIQHCLITDVRLEIYNRWGKQIFAGTGPDASWDGTFKGSQAPEGVYVYVLSYRGRFRRNELNKQQKGTITLLR